VRDFPEVLMNLGQKVRLVPLLMVLLFAGCAESGGKGQQQVLPSTARSGSTPVALEFVRAYENQSAAAYYPLEGLAGCSYTKDGSLIVCDEKRAKVFGLDSGTGRWYEFDTPMVRPYRPVDAQVDGFKILILDNGSNTIQRFDLSGAYQDQLLNLRQLDPGTMIQPVAFAMDRDGRMVMTDNAEQQVLMLDTFLNLSSRMGEPGVQDDQFHEPDGLTFLPDGRIAVSDRGNSRLMIYGRMGFFERTLGGRYDPENPFLAPTGIDADRHGNLFVADLMSGQIHVWGRNFRLLFSSDKELPQAGRPESPVGLAVGPDNQLAVTDRARQSILIYRIIYE
jgi:sugar lactone lactonase YvrE